jgi:protein-tyrosine kinase
MSLIERAVQNLGHPGRPASPGGPAGKSPGEASGRVSLIEAAMDSATHESQKGLAELPAAPAASTAERAETRAPIGAGEPVEPIGIDLARLRARGFITPGSAPSVLQQQFRIIKRPLIANAFGRGANADPRGKRVMVTSALPGEGKSFCAINLAMSVAAERDHQVLLVDADVARPSVPRELGVRTGAGLMDWLIDGAVDIDTLVRPTNVEKLAILSAGRHDAHATELIASSAMTRLLDVLSERYPDRLIVFDSPPLLVTTESRVLASHMGQIVVVVEADKTSRESVNAAIETIQGCEIVGLLLNKATQSSSKGHYDYQGYGYGTSERV